MLRANAERLYRMNLAADLLVGVASFVSLLLFVPGLIEPGSEPLPALLVVGLTASLVWPLVIEHLGLYASQRRTALPRLFVRLCTAAIVATSVVTACGVIVSAPVAPVFFALYGGTQLAWLTVSRVAPFAVLRAFRRRGRNYRNILMVGSGPRAREATGLLEEHPEWGLRIIGYADDGDSAVDEALGDRPIYQLVDLPELFRNEVIDEVVVACPRAMLLDLEPAVRLCAEVGVPFTLLSDLFGDYVPPPRVERLGALPALSFAPVHHSEIKLWIKRGFDAAVAGLLLVAASPILAIAAVAIKLSSPGPVFFRQVRCGLNGRRFEMIKLRTMRQDAEHLKEELAHLNEVSGPVFKMSHDPRITRVGRVLRRWSIDELPQLWNVFRGDMSLVGPRPPIPKEVDQYAHFERRRLSMRPGLTCLWQVSGRSTIGFDEWVQLDVRYIDSWSLTNDFKILLRTIPAVLKGTGAS